LTAEYAEYADGEGLTAENRTQRLSGHGHEEAQKARKRRGYNRWGVTAGRREFGLTGASRGSRGGKGGVLTADYGEGADGRGFNRKEQRVPGCGRVGEYFSGAASGTTKQSAGVSRCWGSGFTVD